MKVGSIGRSVVRYFRRSATQGRGKIARTPARGPDEVRDLIAREIWLFQEADEVYGDWDGVSVETSPSYDEGLSMAALVKQLTIDEAERIRLVLVEAGVL